MLDEPALRDLLADHWGIRSPVVTSHHGGMNSGTWFVRLDGAVLVAKAVPSSRATSFETGLAVAAHVEAAGIRAGAPVATRDGRIVVTGGGATLALLRFVEGKGLTGSTDEEQRRMGTVLGRAHRALDEVTVPGAERFHWIDPDAPHLSSRAGCREGVVEALAAWERIPPTAMAWGLVHSDPAPEAFLFEEAGDVCGLIDWDLGLVAPRMYDIASAVMYLGGPDRAAAFLVAYLATGALAAKEVTRTLRPMLCMRWAVQADYFSRRLADDDRTGITDTTENEHGLDDALQGLERYRDR